MFQRILIRPIISKRSEAEEDFYLLRVRVIDEFAHVVVFHILVVGIVLPRDGKLFGTKSTRRPEDELIYIILFHAVDHLLPLGQAERGHAHEGRIIAAHWERFAFGSG